MRLIRLSWLRARLRFRSQVGVQEAQQSRVEIMPVLGVGQAVAFVGIFDVLDLSPLAYQGFMHVLGVLQWHATIQRAMGQQHRDRYLRREVGR